jgi:1-phosphatidylinositol phosphodiesterase
MFKAYQLQVFNKTDYSFRLNLALEDPEHNPRLKLDNATLSPLGETAKESGLVFGEAATFTATFTSAIAGELTVTAYAGQAAFGGHTKGYLPVVSYSGRAAQLFQVVQSQYDAQAGEQCPNLALAIVPRIDRSTWMSRIDDGTKLHSLTLPGTHDSGTAVDTISSNSICQDLGIAEQLKLGIRFLDIRLNKSKGMEIVHMTDETGLYFQKDCVEVIADFLAGRGKDETILVCIQSEMGTTDGFHDEVVNQLHAGLASRFGVAADKHLYTDTGLPTLGGLRGKIVLVRRYWIDPNTNPQHGSDRRTWGLGLQDFHRSASNQAVGWPPSSDTFNQLGDNQFQFNTPGNQGFAIQDWYNLHDDHMSDKIELIEKYLDAAASGSHQAVWFINFTSCSSSMHIDKPRDYAEGDSGINASVFTYFLTHPRARYGTILTDFVEEPAGLIDLMIDSNAPRLKQGMGWSDAALSGEPVTAAAG